MHRLAGLFAYVRFHCHVPVISCVYVNTYSTAPAPGLRL